MATRIEVIITPEQREWLIEAASLVRITAMAASKDADKVSVTEQSLLAFVEVLESAAEVHKEKAQRIQDFASFLRTLEFPSSGEF